MTAAALGLHQCCEVAARLRCAITITITVTGRGAVATEAVATAVAAETVAAAVATEAVAAAIVADACVELLVFSIALCPAVVLGTLFETRRVIERAGTAERGQTHERDRERLNFHVAVLSRGLQRRMPAPSPTVR
jgi:hypothetical protein